MNRRQLWILYFTRWAFISFVGVLAAESWKHIEPRWSWIPNLMYSLVILVAILHIVGLLMVGIVLIIERKNYARRGLPPSK